VKIYNKLVRDRIPEIIEAEGNKPIFNIMTEEEYYRELLLKLREELNEFLESESLEEIADIYEVLEAIMSYKGISPSQLKLLQSEKRSERGGFDKRIFLYGVEINE